MKRIITLVAAVLVLSCGNTQKTTNNNTVSTQQNQEGINKDVTVKEFAELIKNDGVIIDVRTPEEFNQGHLKGAININIFDADFQNKLSEISKDKPVYVYCKSGGRSKRASNQIANMKFKTVYNMLGGITAWKSNNMPTVK